MKKYLPTLAMIAAIPIIFSMAGYQEEKKYKVELTLNEWVKHSNGLRLIAEQLRQSDLPSRTSNLLMDSVINPLLNDIGAQVNKQLPKDTTKGK